MHKAIVWSIFTVNHSGKWHRSRPSNSVDCFFLGRDLRKDHAKWEPNAWARPGNWKMKAAPGNFDDYWIIMIVIFLLGCRCCRCCCGCCDCCGGCCCCCVCSSSCWFCPCSFSFLVVCVIIVLVVRSRFQILVLVLVGVVQFVLLRVGFWFLLIFCGLGQVCVPRKTPQKINEIK